MATLSIPTVGIVQSSFGLEYNTQIFESPFSKSVQTIGLAGAVWVATYTLRPYKLSEVGPIRAFFSQLRGRSGRFYAYDPDRKTPQGTGSGTPLVKGSGQTGLSLLTDGWGVSQTVLKAGDLFEVNGELKEVTSDVTSDGSGNATINFEPALRASPVDNAPITVSTPKCTMALSADDTHLLQSNFNKVFTDITFSGREIFS